MMDLLDKFLLAMLAVLILVGFAALIMVPIAYKEEKAFKESCRDKDGVLLRSQNGLVCVDNKIIVKL